MNLAPVDVEQAQGDGARRRVSHAMAYERDNVTVAVNLQAAMKTDALTLVRSSSVTAAYIEHRPKSSDPNTSTSYFAIVAAGGREQARFKTQKEATDRARSDGYRPVYVARVRHLQDRNKPDHWCVVPC